MAGMAKLVALSLSLFFCMSCEAQRTYDEAGLVIQLEPIHTEASLLTWTGGDQRTFLFHKVTAVSVTAGTSTSNPSPVAVLGDTIGCTVPGGPCRGSFNVTGINHVGHFTLKLHPGSDKFYRFEEDTIFEAYFEAESDCSRGQGNPDASWDLNGYSQTDFCPKGEFEWNPSSACSFIFRARYAAVDADVELSSLHLHAAPDAQDSYWSDRTVMFRWQATNQSDTGMWSAGVNVEGQGALSVVDQGGRNESGALACCIADGSGSGSGSGCDGSGDGSGEGDGSGSEEGDGSGIGGGDSCREEWGSVSCSCTFVRNNANTVDELPLGTAPDEATCIKNVLERCKWATIANYGDDKSCWCQRGSDRTEDAGSLYRSCWLDGATCTEGRAWAALPASAGCNCSFVQTNRNHENEQYVGTAPSQRECIDLVRHLCPWANIANHQAQTRDCYCQFGDDQRVDASSWDSCWLASASCSSSPWQDLQCAAATGPCFPTCAASTRAAATTCVDNVLADAAVTTCAQLDGVIGAVADCVAGAGCCADWSANLEVFRSRPCLAACSFPACAELPNKVRLQLALPYTVAEFQARRLAFRRALADAAGVALATVRVVKVTALRRRAAARTLLQNTIQVDTEIEAASAAEAGTVVGRLTVEAINSELAAEGLDPATLSSAPVAVTPDSPAVPGASYKAGCEWILLSVAAAMAVLLTTR